MSSRADVTTLYRCLNILRFYSLEHDRVGKFVLNTKSSTYRIARNVMDAIGGYYTKLVQFSKMNCRLLRDRTAQQRPPIPAAACFMKLSNMRIPGELLCSKLIQVQVLLYTQRSLQL